MGVGLLFFRVCLRFLSCVLACVHASALLCFEFSCVSVFVWFGCVEDIWLRFNKDVNVRHV